MTKRRKILLLFAGLVLAVGVYWFFIRESEPSYLGRKLSDWVEGMGAGLPQGDRANPETREALAQMGAKAVPYLVKWMDYETPAWQDKLDDFSRAHDLSLDSGAYEIYKRADAAARAFAFVGPEGRKAIPAVLRLLQRSKPGTLTFTRAACALGYIGTETLPHLAAGLTNQTPQYRRDCASALGLICLFGSNASTALPPLLQALSDTDVGVRMHALYALGETKMEPALVVPRLTNALQDTNAVVRMQAARALGRRGKEAISAVPSLAQALKDREEVVRTMAAEALGAIGEPAREAVPTLQQTLHDKVPSVRRYATNALLKIAPEALTNAPPR